jgi:hypothetical protein
VVLAFSHDGDHRVLRHGRHLCVWMRQPWNLSRKIILISSICISTFKNCIYYIHFHYLLVMRRYSN